MKYDCWSCLTVEFHSKNHQFTCLTSVIIVLWCNMACWQNNWEATDLSWHLKCQSPDSSSVTMQVILIITIIVNHGHHHRHLWQSLKFNFFVFSFLCPLPYWTIYGEFCFSRTQEPGWTLRSFKIWNHWQVLNQCQLEDDLKAMLTLSLYHNIFCKTSC